MTHILASNMNNDYSLVVINGEVVARNYHSSDVVINGENGEILTNNDFKYFKGQVDRYNALTIRENLLRMRAVAAIPTSCVSGVPTASEIAQRQVWTMRNYGSIYETPSHWYSEHESLEVNLRID